jgi:hypothetical protein
MSMAEFVDGAELIVTGTVTGGSFLGYFGGYDPVTSEMILSSTRVEPWDGISLPTSNIEVRVEEVLKGDGSVVEDSSIIVAEYGVFEPTARPGPCEDVGFPSQSVIGDRFLWALTLEPDGTAYGPTWGVHSRLRFDEARVLVTDCPEREPEWAPADPVAFLASLETHLPPPARQ